MTKAEEFVRYALGIGAIELIPEGRILKSGRRSPYFFNSGLFSTGEALCFLAKAYAREVGNSTMLIHDFFGLSYKGIPLAAAVAVAVYHLYDVDVGYTFNRKEEKDHGEGSAIVGHPINGRLVCIVDDVITTGGSCDNAVKIIRREGGIPVGCVIAFDRKELDSDSDNLSATEKFRRKHKIPAYTIASLKDLITVLQKERSPRSESMLPLILDYEAKYCI